MSEIKDKLGPFRGVVDELPPDFFGSSIGESVFGLADQALGEKVSYEGILKFLDNWLSSFIENHPELHEIIVTNGDGCELTEPTAIEGEEVFESVRLQCQRSGNELTVKDLEVHRYRGARKHIPSFSPTWSIRRDRIIVSPGQAVVIGSILPGAGIRTVTVLRS